MTKTRITQQRVDRIRTEVTSMVSTGMTKNTAFHVVAPRFNLSPRTIENLYYGKGALSRFGSPLKAAQHAHPTIPRQTITITATIDRSDLGRFVDVIQNLGITSLQFGA